MFLPIFWICYLVCVCVLGIEQANEQQMHYADLIIRTSGYVHDNSIEHLCCQQSQSAMPMFTIC